MLESCSTVYEYGSFLVLTNIAVVEEVSLKNCKVRRDLAFCTIEIHLLIYLEYKIKSLEMH